MQQNISSESRADQGTTVAQDGYEAATFLHAQFVEGKSNPVGCVVQGQCQQPLMVEKHLA